MEDVNYENAKDDNNVSVTVGKLSYEEPAKFPSNGHALPSDVCSPLSEQYHAQTDVTIDEKTTKRVNPLKIHLGKRPFVDNSSEHHISSKKRAPNINRPCESNIIPSNNASRVPRLIPKKKVNKSQFNHATSSNTFLANNELGKPVPRLVPKSQLLQYKKNTTEQGAFFNDYPQSTTLQPNVKFKCRKCCSMSFKTLALLKEHQLVCRAQTKEPSQSPEAAPSIEATSEGSSRVTRKLYLCSACGTYYENWNLFLHMREVHNRHICLFCLGMFSKAEKLAAHLTNKHSVQEYSYDTKDDFCSFYSGSLYLMCCKCDEICSEQDDFLNHDCEKAIPKPVPVLVSKSTCKINNLKQNKINSEITGNGSSLVKQAKLSENTDSSKQQSNEVKCDPDVILPNTVTTVNDNKSEHSLTSNSESKSNTCEVSDISDANKEELHRLKEKPVSPTINLSIERPTDRQKPLPNGDESSDTSDQSDSPVSMTSNSPVNILPEPIETPPIERPPEKENCGIKLKLSLNKANSPVIINSTVDPTVGQHSNYKPPSRPRRPPKRYDKDNTTAQEPLQPRTPSIKMTICDKADSPFVKTTIYEDDQKTMLKSLLNNNLETLSSKPFPNKPDNTMLSTIYDNKLDDIDTLNRVPKLTVRVPKELLDKDSSSDYSSDSDISDKLTVDENIYAAKEQIVTKEEPHHELSLTDKKPFQTELLPLSQENPKDESSQPKKLEDIIKETKGLPEETKVEPESQIDVEKVTDEPPADEIPIVELKLDRPLDKYTLKELLRVLLSSTVYNCIYCNHVRKIAINCEQLSLHMAAEHRFSATVDSITAEELMPETITAKVKAEAYELRPVFINLDSYDSEVKCENVQYDHLFECFQCYFKTAIHKDLYLHNRKMHQKTILLCVMCKSNFYSYSELLCHLCPGAYDSDYEIKYRCCLCNVDSIPSSFRLMVHLRKIHNACDVCLEFCFSQAKLSNHVWKHKLHHLCYRCGIAYRNKPDITKHLFWKHGTESVLCKKCLQKKWPHVYHFCTPPAVFVCDECNLQFTKAVCLKVHKRFHSNEFPHSCLEEDCTEKFVSKKLLMKHLEEHQRKLATVNIEEKMDQNTTQVDKPGVISKEPTAVIDLVNDKPREDNDTTAPDGKCEAETEKLSKKAKKRKQKEKEALLLDVNLPELNLSESDSSDESDSCVSQPIKEEKIEEKPKVEQIEEKPVISPIDVNVDTTFPKVEEKSEQIEEDKPDQQQILDIWDNFKKYQAQTEKIKEKTPPLVPIKKHVCDSDHDYCLIPSDMNGENDVLNSDKKKIKKKDKKHDGNSSSSSSSSSDSDSSCSCGSNCSCSSSSGSSSSSSSDSYSSDEPNKVKKKKQKGKSIPNRRLSNGSNVDVMGMSETPVLMPEKTEPQIAETDLETDESDTDEEFYDEHPQRLANKLYAEKRNQLMLLASVAPSDGGSVSGEASRPVTPVKEEKDTRKEKSSNSKKKSKKKKRSKSSRKHEPIKINIPKQVISISNPEPTPAPTPPAPLVPNKITISLQSNTVQIPEPTATPLLSITSTPLSTTLENKRASKRRRVPNKFYGYSSDDEHQSTPHSALKPQQPPKLEWRKEDLPSPVTHKAKAERVKEDHKKKEVPSSTISHTLYNYKETIRLIAPIPDPEPPRILMNTESMESSDSDTSDEGQLEIYQPHSMQNPIPVPPPTYLNSGTSSLPYAFQRPAGRQAREGESVYCYCRCPYDEVSEMIACDADGCAIEWFHFECVGIMVPPKGKWYCPECRKNFAGYR